MIEIRYEKDDLTCGASTTFDDEATLWDILYGLVRVCEFAGYQKESFDHIIKEAINDIDSDYSFKDYLMDREV